MSFNCVVGTSSCCVVSEPPTLHPFKIHPNSRASTNQCRSEGQKQGPIVFLDEIAVMTPYLNFRRKAVPNATFHLGSESSSAQAGSILVPVGTRYKIVGGVPGAEIIQHLQEAQNFFFDAGTQIIIHANTPFSIGGEKEMFCQDTIVTMA
jgi:hypothetical protein